MSDEHRAYPILYVDDEPQNLFTFRYAMEDRFTVLTARDGREAMSLLASEDIAVLMCDQRMPEMTGVEVCRRASELKPDVVRIIVTAYADLQAAVDAINKGQVLRYMTKPWRNDELVEVLQSSVELVKLRRLVQDMQSRLLRGGHPPAIEAMTRQIASELRAPLSSLELNKEQVADLLTAGLSSWTNSDRAHALVQHAHETHSDSRPPIDHLRSIVQKLERGQRLAPPALPSATDAVRVVRATARIVGGSLDPRLRLQLVMHASPTVGMDAAALGQVLVQLVTNAAQSMDGELEPGRNVITVQVAETATEGEISISDCGSGIPPERLEQIFDPYFTTRDGGAGLGLSFARHLVAQAGGTISVDSRVASGSRFTIRLPRAF
jgi:two-component system NtrC family sensor kinase